MGGTKKQDLETAERRAKVIILRKGGATLQQIADTLGYSSRGAVHNVLTQELGKLREEATSLHALENMRLDDAVRGIYPKVLAGDTRAVEVFVKLSERRAKLNGLDDYEARMAAVAERQAAVSEAQTLMMARVLASAVDKLGLDPAKREQAIEIIAAELEQVEAEQAAH